MKTPFLFALALLSSLTMIAHATVAVLPPTPDLSETKLMGRWPVTLNPSNYREGQTVALSDKWALSGTIDADDIGSVIDDGAVQVFSATTGAWVRLLRPPAPIASNEYFGGSLAISGDLGVIAAYGYGTNRGAVFIFNLATGALVRTLLAADGVAGDFFGSSLAVSGGKVLVGASGDDANQGSAYLFDLATGVQLQKFKGSTAIANEFFGYAVAMDGNVALVSAPYHNASRGAVYAFDLTTYTEISVIVPVVSLPSDHVGFALALSQGIAVMSAPGHNSNAGVIFTKDLRSNAEHTLIAAASVSGNIMGWYGVAASQGMVLASSRTFAGNTGGAYLFDLHTGDELREIQPTDSASGKGFGSAVAMWGNTALVGSSVDSLPLYATIGSAYLIKPLMTSMPVTKVAARADSAPGVPETTFGTLNDAFTNSDGETAFSAKLSGAASHSNSDIGIWTSLQTSGNLGLTAVTNRISGYPGQVLTLGNPILNQTAFELYPVSFKVGVGGVTATTSKALFLSSPTTTLFFTSGSAMPPFGVSQVASFLEPVQTFSGANNRFAVSCTLKLDASTVAGSDSAFFIYDYTSGLSDGRREGVQVQPSNTFNSITYGQFSGRLSYLRNSLAYSATIAGPVANNAVLMQKAYNVTETLVAQKGVAAPGSGVAAFSTFVGETTSPVEDMLYRATLSGSPSSTNEGLWTTTAGVSTLLLRKGTPSALLPPGLSIAKFINYWHTGAATSCALALVQLAGAGVNSANDQALILIQENGSANILLREGQAAPGCSPTTIGVISRVDVDPWLGTYAIVATLAGAPAGTELALFTGVAVSAGNATTLSTLRRPVLFLRKGQLYNNQPSKIKSFSLPTTNLTASGAGGTGRGRSISWSGNFVIAVEFDNAVRQIMKGTLSLN